MFRKVLLIWFLLIFAVILRCFLFYTNKPTYSTNQSLSLTGTIQNQPKNVGNSQRFSLATQQGFVSVSTDRNSAYWYGEKVTVKGEIKKIEKGGSIFYSMTRPKIIVASDQSFVAQITAKIRAKVLQIYLTILPSDMANLLLGMVFGVQGNFSSSFLKHLQISGVMHVIAASGMNITLIGGLVFAMTTKFLSRKLAVGISLLAILFYTALAGFAPSIVRAAIMGGCIFLALLSGRQRQGVYILFLTACLMLIYTPSWLTDIGFQLSVMATYGILLFEGAFARLARGLVKKENIFFDDILVTLAAQLTTLPILLTNFGYYNPLSILINVFILWTVPPLMLLGGIAVLAGSFFLPLAKLLLLLSYPFLWYFKLVVDWSATIPSVWHVVNVSPFFVVGYYLILLGISIGVLKHKKKEVDVVEVSARSSS